MSKRLTPEELIGMMEGDAPPLLLDVRNADKYAAGHLPGAAHLPLSQIRDGKGDLPAERSLVVY